jgi:broad specificity phosphatase PhoE
MLQIILIRPGLTDYGRERRIQGTLDIPLNDEGNSEVARVVEDLQTRGIEAVYAPACQPAQQTAEAIANALDIKLRKLERMHNLDHGLWQGKLIEEVRRRQPKVYRQWQEQPETICPPGGEMLGQAEERIRAAMCKLLKRHKEGVIALVLPEPMATLVRHYLTQSDLGDLWKVSVDHANWEVLEVEPESLAQSS